MYGLCALLLFDIVINSQSEAIGTIPAKQEKQKSVFLLSEFCNAQTQELHNIEHVCTYFDISHDDTNTKYGHEI